MREGRVKVAMGTFLMANAFRNNTIAVELHPHSILFRPPILQLNCPVRHFRFHRYPSHQPELSYTSESRSAYRVFPLVVPWEVKPVWMGEEGWQRSGGLLFHDPPFDSGSTIVIVQ